MRFHHLGTSHRHPNPRWSRCYSSYTRMVKFWIKCRTFSRTLGKVKLLAFPTTYIAEQIFCQILHTCNKYSNRLDMNKPGGNAIRLNKLTNLRPALKKLADKHHRKVRISWNQLFFWKLIIFILRVNLHSFCSFVLLLCWPDFPFIFHHHLNYFQNKMTFSDNAKITGRGRFSKKVSRRGAIVKKRLKTTALEKFFKQKQLYSHWHATLSVTKD